jgi:hypothetical protein
MYVEDQFADRLPVPLYEPELHSGKVIDYAGTESVQRIRVPSALANRHRRLDRIVARHEQNGALGRPGWATPSWCGYAQAQCCRA